MTTKSSYKEIVLPNKLRVLLYQIESVMSVYAILYVRTGTVYEKGNLRGISHFTEHVPFLGTKKYPNPLALSQTIQQIGGIRNGSTSRFNTCYWIGLPYTNIKEGLNYLYQLVYEPLIESSQVKKERGVIISEYNDFWHNPEKKFYYHAWRKRFKQKEHPYSYLVWGTPKTINTINKTDIVSWRDKYYHPANMILSLAGNIKPNQINNLIKSNFAKLNAGAKRREPKFSTKDYSGYSLYYEKENRSQIKFTLSFPLFGWKEISREKRLQIRLLNNIIGASPASRLFQRIREKEKLVYRIRSGINYHTWMGAFIISGSVPADKLVPAMKAIKEEIDKLIKLGVTNKEIELSRTHMSSLTLMKFDKPESIAYYFGGQAFDDEEIWFPEDYIKKANKITKADLDKIAKKMFDYSKINISLLGNISEKTLKEVEKVFN